MKNSPHHWLFKGKLMAAVGFVGVAFAHILFSPSVAADPFKPAVLSQKSGTATIHSAKNENSSAVYQVEAGEVFYSAPFGEGWWIVQVNDNKSGFIRPARIKIIEGQLMTPADIDPAAEPTDSPTQHLLGLKFARGIGVKTDPARAAYWFEKAASQGHLGGKASLAMLYFQGEGVKRDRRLAKGMIEEGLAKEDPRSLITLAWFVRAHANESHDLGTKHRLISQNIAILDKAVAAGGEDGARASWLRAGSISELSEIRIAAVSRLWDVVTGAGSSRKCDRCVGIGREFTNSGVSGISCQACGGSGYADD